MNSKLAKTGMALSLIYAVFFIMIFHGQIFKLANLQANEIGDFFAGVFGPLAILWLILGFFQQGLELSQNTKALELQAEELRASVDQQKELVTITREQYKSITDRQRKLDAITRASSLPKFIWSRESVSSTTTGIRYSVNLENRGLLATDIVLESDSPNIDITPQELKALNGTEHLRIEFNISDKITSEFSKESEHLDVGIIVQYLSKDGEPCNKAFLLSLEDRDEWSMLCHGIYDEEPHERDSGL